MLRGFARPDGAPRSCDSRMTCPRVLSSTSPVWIFDLDNTLHDASPGIFPRMNRAMTDYVARHLGVDEDEANDLRVRYWRRYGATLLGLMRHHGTDPHHFLWHTHQFPDIDAIVLGHPALRGALLRLPGRRIVFSNSPEHYCRAVLRALRVLDLFEGVFTIEHTRFRPKPDRRGFHHLLRRHGLHARQCVMVEDNLENLITAKRLGMRTILVSPVARRPLGVDHVVASVTRLPGLLRHL